MIYMRFDIDSQDKLNHRNNLSLFLNDEIIGRTRYLQILFFPKQTYWRVVLQNAARQCNPSSVSLLQGRTNAQTCFVEMKSSNTLSWLFFNPVFTNFILLRFVKSNNFRYTYRSMSPIAKEISYNAFYVNLLLSKAYLIELAIKRVNALELYFYYKRVIIRPFESSLTGIYSFSTIISYYQQRERELFAFPCFISKFNRFKSKSFCFYWKARIVSVSQWNEYLDVVLEDVEFVLSLLKFPLRLSYDNTDLFID